MEAVVCFVPQRALLTPHASDRARRMRDVLPDTLCSFISNEREQEQFSGMAAGPGIGIENDISTEVIQTAALDEEIKLWPWVNQVNAQNHIPALG